ncbi:hypothetical protein MUK42_22739 [Musa troglodytarum]|uniref:Uncharacterized protein n=1 Tax=Musa troglodytarum TaxID=320322 RepID=A0A9E7G5L4_9LILI|nr:hypothetical protein MUK42_22739 [Musa troglodytarum]
MEYWWEQVVVIPMRRVQVGVAARLGIRRSGLRKLRKEVRTCEYEDVHVLWEMLQKSADTEARRDTPAIQRRRRTSLFHWSPCNLRRNL